MDVPSSASQLQTLPNDEAIAVAVSTTLPTFVVEALKPLQLLALRYLVRGRDVFACFPTGFGKSLIFHILPFVVVDWLQTASSSISGTLWCLLCHLCSC